MHKIFNFSFFLCYKTNLLITRTIQKILNMHQQNYRSLIIAIYVLEIA